MPICYYVCIEPENLGSMQAYLRRYIFNVDTGEIYKKTGLSNYFFIRQREAEGCDLFDAPPISDCVFQDRILMSITQPVSCIRTRESNFIKTSKDRLNIENDSIINTNILIFKMHCIGFVCVLKC